MRPSYARYLWSCNSGFARGRDDRTPASGIGILQIAQGNVTSAIRLTWADFTLRIWQMLQGHSQSRSYSKASDSLPLRNCPVVCSCSWSSYGQSRCLPCEADGEIGLQ
jgi:hypothetical protein